MKKKSIAILLVLMMSLTAFTGCGSTKEEPTEPTDKVETPVTDENEAADTEDETTEDVADEEEKADDQDKEEADDSKSDEKTEDKKDDKTESKPAESKPSSKPSESKPAESKPSSKPSTKPSTSTSGSTDSKTDDKKPEDSKEESKATVAETLKKAFNKEIKNNTDLISVGENLLTEDNGIYFAPFAQEVEEGWLNGFKADITGFNQGVFFGPMIGSIPFVGYLFETDDTDALVKELKANYNLSWNICTEADNMEVATYGNYVFFVMAPEHFDEY